MALTPSWTRAFHVCSNFLMNLGTDRGAQVSLLAQRGREAGGRGQGARGRGQAKLTGWVTRTVRKGQGRAGMWAWSAGRGAGPRLLGVATTLGRGQAGRGRGRLLGVACAPVGLQDVDDSYVQQQPLPAPIHGRDPAHPAGRGPISPTRADQAGRTSVPGATGQPLGPGWADTACLPARMHTAGTQGTAA